MLLSRGMTGLYVVVSAASAASAATASRPAAPSWAAVSEGASCLPAA